MRRWPMPIGPGSANLIRCDRRPHQRAGRRLPFERGPGRLQSALRPAPRSRCRPVSRARRCAAHAPCPSWRASLLCGDAELALATGLRAAKKYTMFNGARRMHACCSCDPIQPPRAKRASSRRRRRCRKARRWSPTACARTCKRLKTWRDAQRRSAAIASTMPTCRNIRRRSTCTRKPMAQQRQFLHVQEYAAPDTIPEADYAPPLRRIAGRAARSVRAAARTDRGEDRGARQGRQQVRPHGPARRILRRRRRRGAGCGSTCTITWIPACSWTTGPLRLRIAREARGQAFPQPVRLHRRGHRACRGRRRRQTTSVDLSATYLRVGGAEPRAERRRPAPSIGWCRPTRCAGWRPIAANTT